MDNTNNVNNTQPTKKVHFKLNLKERQALVKLSLSLVLTLVASLVPLNFWVSLILFIAAYLISGYKVLSSAIKNIMHGDFFDENFLMSIATIGAFAIGQYAEAVAVMIFFGIGDFFEDIAVSHSQRSISALLEVKPEFANLKTADGFKQVDPEQVQLGDTIIVKAGERVPLDGVIIAGSSSLDTSALTGESAPRSVHPNDDILSGAINQSGLLTLKVTKVYADSTVARILDLVQNAQATKAPTEKFITKFSKVYTPIVVAIALLLAIVPPLITGDWSQWIYRALIFLVVSCPCALVISVPLGFFSGIGAASRQGILVKGSNYLEAIKDVDTIVFDKTGTLTKGNFTVTGINSYNGFTEAEVLANAAIAEQNSNHPIAKSIVADFKGDLSKAQVTDLTEVPGHGITVTIDQHNVIVGNLKAMTEIEQPELPVNLDGTMVYVSIDNLFAGAITIADELKPDAQQAIAQLKQNGIQQTIMLTGDNQQVGEAVGKELRIDTVHTELLPADKVNILQKLQQAAQTQKHHKIAFVGDGINDTPVLTTADIGIAMGGAGADAAIEAADVVIMSDEPSRINSLIKIAQRTRTIVIENIALALAVKLIFLTLGALGMIDMWEAVISDVGVTVIAILNASRILKVK